MPSKLQCVEDDLEESLHEHGVAVNVAPVVVKPIPVTVNGLVRPIATKVVRPVARRVTQQFYNEAYQQGVSVEEARQAALVAQDWHRKWTQQDEQGHTTPHQDFYQQSFDNAVIDPDFDRLGAKNPSLGDSDGATSDEGDVFRGSLPLDVEFRSTVSLEDADATLCQVLFCPDDRLSASSYSSQCSSLSSYMAPQVKRQYTGVIIERDDDEFQQPDVNSMVRPVAVRAVRPALPPAPHDIPHGGIPHDITAVVERDCFSPVSFSETSMTSETFMITLANQQQRSTFQAPTQFDLMDDEDDEEESTSDLPKPSRALPRGLMMSRDGLLHALAITQGDVESEKFKLALEPLTKYFGGLDVDTRPRPSSCCERSVEGMWLTLSKPTYFSNLGENDSGDPLYTLGRMAFDMFSPTNIVCSLQGNFNPVEIVDENERKNLLDRVPKSLREEVESGETVIRTYQ